jgi:Copper binding periplasmic protein CusF
MPRLPPALAFCLRRSAAAPLAALSLLAVCCGGGETTARTYTVRGIVRQLPAPDDPSRQLLVLHAPIPDYVNSEGYETGMASMTMPFPVAPEVDLSGIAAGDAVELALRVDWEASPRMQLIAVRRLPGGVATAP